MAAPELSREQMAAEAYATPPIRPTGVGPAVNGVIYTLTVLGTIVLFLRLWVRFRPGQARGYDDAAAFLGWALFIPANVFGVMATYYGLGAPDEVFADSPYLKMRGAEYVMYFAILYMASSTATKIAINLAVLRLAQGQQQRHWRWTVLGNLLLMLTVGTGGLVFLLVDCVPFSLFSNPFLGTCRSGHRGFLILSYFGSSVQMLTDWVSALVPLCIISQTQMPFARKASVIAVLMLGVFASIAAMLRIVWYRYWDETRYPTGYMSHTAGVVMWSELEAGLGLIACSVPPLRKLLGSWAAQVYASGTGAWSRGGTTKGTATRGTKSGTRTGTRNRTVGAGEEEEEESDGVHMGHIVRQTDVEITSTQSVPEKVRWDVESRHAGDVNGSQSALV